LNQKQKVKKIQTPGCFDKTGKTFVFSGDTICFFNSKTARKWRICIDCMESQDSPALRNKVMKGVHVKQRKAGRILFKKKRNYAFSPDGRILMKIVSEQVFRRTKTPIRLEHLQNL
jgi:hypothetical protein